VSDSGISWAICKSAPHSRQTTTPVPHHSVFYRPDALPAAQPTASKHWRQKHWRQFTIVHIVHYCSLFSIFDIILNHTYFWPAKVVAKLNYTTVAALHMSIVKEIEWWHAGVIIFWSERHMVFIWSSRCHCHSVICLPVLLQCSELSLLILAYLGCPESCYFC